MPNPNPIMISAKIYECRETMRDLFGDQFQAVIAGNQRHLMALSKHKGISILDAALDTAHALRQGGYEKAIPLMLAAAVELIEPSIPPFA